MDLQPPLLDGEALAHNAFGDEKLALEVLALFSERLDLMVGRLVAAAGPSSIFEAAHTLCGAARAVGAAALAALAEAVGEARRLAPEEAARLHEVAAETAAAIALRLGAPAPR